jgi:chemotaxis protein methyltransferase CheR
MSCSDTDYAYLRDLVLTESANLIDPSRNGLFETRLKPMAKRAGASTLEDFVNILRVDQTEHLHRAVA